MKDAVIKTKREGSFLCLILHKFTISLRASVMKRFVNKIINTDSISVINEKIAYETKGPA
ncbi:hypothetical protein [Niallia taxi]|uniref:hypothetical protein n=1 Tax=Niallia taxi TaxID=2499688 RepID=UPI00196B1E21|nr:hypothetical protein [Niallia taxi]